MIVIAICIVAGLACWVVLRLDRNARLRSVLVEARIWKALNIKCKIERDAPLPGVPGLPSGTVVDEGNQTTSLASEISNSSASLPPPPAGMIESRLDPSPVAHPKSADSSAEVEETPRQ